MIKKNTSLGVICVLFVLIFAGLPVKSQTNPAAQTLPYSQGFSSLLHTSTTYPAGWQGWQYSTNPGGTYQYTPATGDRNLAASVTASTNSNNVNNYNGKIGFLNTGSFDLGLVLAINTTGNSNVVVKYDAMTIRSQQDGTTSNNRVNGLELQYRVGTSGNFKPAGSRVYFNQQGLAFNQTTAVTTPQNTQTFTVTLPSECDNQSVVQLRWVSRQIAGGGGRPSFAIDSVDVRQNGLNTNYYWNGSGSITSVTSWGTNTDGSGTNPANFTNNLQTFNIRNNSTATISSNWVVSGYASKIVVGDGTNSVNFTIPSLNTVSGVIDVSNSSTLTLSNTTLPTLGNIGLTSSIIFSTGSSITTLPCEPSYNNLTLSGSSITYTYDLATPNILVRKNLTLDGASMEITGFGGSFFTFNCRVGGNLTMQNSAALGTNFQTYAELRLNGTDNQTISTNGLTANFNIIRVENDSTKTVTLSSTGGNTTLTASGGTSTGLRLEGGSIVIESGCMLTLGASATQAGSLTYTRGSISGQGTFKRWIPASGLPTSFSGTVGLFPMGSSSDKRFATLVFSAATITTGGTISITHNNDAGTTMYGLPFSDGALTIDKRHNMNWEIAAADGLNLGATTVSLRLEGMGIPNISSIGDLSLVTSIGAAGGSFSAATGTTSDPSVNRSGMNLANINETFFVGATSSSTLPVTMASFTSSVRLNNAALSWSTSSELNNSGFDVERSENGSTWIKTGFVKGNGTTSTVSSYSFTDLNLRTGKYYYRLKQIDFNGNFEYHNLAEAVIIGKPLNSEVFQNYPNPFNPVTNISFALAEDSFVKLTVYDAAGREVKKLIDGNLTAGYNTLSFDASGIASGVYFYRLESAGSSGVKFIKIMKMLVVK
ncbi:MAG: T9SS type A sorting domain-containing protein [Ignavibacteria bacterium]|nr:T9SS type A sorting domain-containing protein [Ignavibacteria bacterium]